MSYPPRPAKTDDIEKILEVMRGIVPEHGAIYVSAPITSGRRLTDWYVRSNGSLPNRSHPDYATQHVREVIEPNRAHAAAIVHDVRARFPDRIIIDPTAVADLDGWTQDDYRFFWGEVIRRFATSVVFVDGWQFSSGCAYEFVIATEAGVGTLDERLEPLSFQSGKALLREATRDIEPAADAAAFLKALLEDVEPAVMAS
ncbi:MAG: hypothetical protein QOH71_1729 [Blastocatellia bacterium]|jgi:hypothetical protein|nr:hypothetical protein [Blastocatellia bacterium]